MKSVQETGTLSFARALLEIRRARAVVLPDKSRAHEFAEDLLGVLFPHFSTEAYYLPEEIEGRLRLIQRNLKQILAPLEARMKHSAERTAELFLAALPEIHYKLVQDAEAIFQGDPAAESVDEVISAYPGFFAIAVYRIAHEFYLQAVPVFPRILTEYAHQKTGIDIHPGASIGSPFFIDHGTGIVIGETTVIGSGVKIYQGVTLGALSVSKEMSATKRHPTIEDNVVIYSNATILGGETVIGHDSVVGGNVWLTESVRPYSTVYHKSEIKVRTAQDEGIDE
jgi:serine O-acetyltransferase